MGRRLSGGPTSLLANNVSEELLVSFAVPIFSSKQKQVMKKNTLQMVALTEEQIRQAAPQAYAVTPKPGLSAKYSFLPTSRIISDMNLLGWKVGSAKANRSRTSINQEYGNHVIKFFHPEVFIQDGQGNIESYINVVVLNNHTGTGSFKFELGIFRLVCSNGLVVKDKDMGSFNIRHAGYSFEQLRATMNTAIEKLPELVGKINQYNSIVMSPEQQREFARQAIALRSFSDRLPTEEELQSILEPRRLEDRGDSLWVVLNRIQESVLNGGYLFTSNRGKSRKAKSIRNIQKDIQVNQQIWELGMQYA